MKRMYDMKDCTKESIDSKDERLTSQLIRISLL